MKKKHALILALLITLLIASNVYLVSLFDKPTKETATISRVIDGDTLETTEGERLRLININTPEKSEKGYEEAIQFIFFLENRTVEIEILGLDRYQRTLVRVFTPEYLNIEIVKRGLAKKFLVHESELSEFEEAEEFAIENSLGIWEHSVYFNCLNSKLDPEEEIATIINTCEDINFKNFIITDESRKRYKFPSINLGEVNLHSQEGKNNETDLFWNLKQNVWNNDRDTLYIFDAEGKIAHYESYGY